MANLSFYSSQVDAGNEEMGFLTTNLTIQQTFTGLVQVSANIQQTPTTVNASIQQMIQQLTMLYGQDAATWSRIQSRANVLQNTAALVAGLGNRVSIKLAVVTTSQLVRIQTQALLNGISTQVTMNHIISISNNITGLQTQRAAIVTVNTTSTAWLGSAILLVADANSLSGGFSATMFKNVTDAQALMNNATSALKSALAAQTANMRYLVGVGFMLHCLVRFM